MVFNDTRVFPAKLYGNKEKTGARIEVFLLRAREVQAGSGGHYGAFVGGVDGLEGVNVHFFRLAADVFGQRFLPNSTATKKKQVPA